MITIFYIFKKREERPHIKQRLEDIKNLWELRYLNKKIHWVGLMATDCRKKRLVNLKWYGSINYPKLNRENDSKKKENSICELCKSGLVHQWLESQKETGQKRTEKDV